MEHPHEPGPRPFRLANAATNRRAAKADRAAAARLRAAGERVAAALEHRAALGVTAGAGDADAVRRTFTLAVAAAKVALANGHAVPGAGAATEPAGERSAKVLQGGAGDFVITFAVNLEAPLALFELDVASGDRAESRSSCRGCSRSGGGGSKLGAIENHRAGHRRELHFEATGRIPFEPRRKSSGDAGNGSNS